MLAGVLLRRSLFLSSIRGHTVEKAGVSNHKVMVGVFMVNAPNSDVAHESKVSLAGQGVVEPLYPFPVVGAL